MKTGDIFLNTVKTFFNRIVHINRGTDLKDFARLHTQCKERDIKLACHEAGNPDDYLLPPHMPITRLEYAEVMDFYQVIHQASVDRLDRILVFFGPVKLVSAYVERAERVFQELHYDWDVVYFGCDSYQLAKREEPNKLVQKVWSAKGALALAINNSFYPLFLEDSRIPVCNLDDAIKRLNLCINIFVVIPPLVVRA